MDLPPGSIKAAPRDHPGMRTVEVSRRIAATPREIRRHVDPPRLIELEGTFNPVDVTEEAEGTTVMSRGGGMTVEFRFVETDSGYRYEQAGDAGPIETLETDFVIEPRDEGAISTITSSVSLGIPPSAIFDRLAAWKRRGELKRALKELAADVE